MADPITSAVVAWAAKKVADSTVAKVRRRRLRNKDAPEVRQALVMVVRGGVDDFLARSFPDDGDQQQVRALFLERSEDEWPLVDGGYPVDLPAATREWVSWIESPPGVDGRPELVPSGHPFAVELCVAILERLRHAAMRGERVLAPMWLDFVTVTGVDRSSPPHRWSLEYWNPMMRGVALVGRGMELEALEAALGVGGGIGKVQSISGLPGIGKTALAVAFGESARDRYPDGRIFYDFHSYGLDRAPATAAEALGQILPSIHPEISAVEIGDLSPDELVSAWRECTASRRILAVWDNIKHPDQVAPLLLHQDGCGTIITSRDSIAIEGHAMTLWLDALSEPEAIALFTQIAGSGHSQDRVAELVKRDLYMPVLIQSHATAVATDRYRLNEIITDLPAATRLSAPRTQKELFRRLNGSYQHLNADQQYALRAFGAHPGPIATLESLSAILGCDGTEMRDLMDALLDAGMVKRHYHQPENSDPELRAYTAHDLLRAYAAHMAEQAGETSTIGTSLAIHYLHKLTRIGDREEPWLEIEQDSIRETALAGTLPVHGRLSLQFANRYRSMMHTRTLARLAYHAAEIARADGDRHLQARALIAAGRYENYREHGSNAARSCYEHSLKLAVALSDQGLEAAAKNGLGNCAYHHEKYDLAAAHHQAAAELAVTADDSRAQFEALRGLARIAEHREAPTTARNYHLQALQVAEEAELHKDAALLLRSLALQDYQDGDYDAALKYDAKAASFYKVLGDTRNWASATSSMGRTARQAADADAALEFFQGAYRLYELTEEKQRQAEQLDQIAEVEAGRGRAAVAEEAWKESAAIYEEIGDHTRHSMALSRLSRLARATGDLALAFAHAYAAVRLVEDLDDRYGMLGSRLSELANLAEETEDHTTAADCYRRLAARAESRGAPRQRGGYLRALGRKLLASESTQNTEELPWGIAELAGLGVDGIDGLLSMADDARRSGDYRTAAECYAKLSAVCLDIVNDGDESPQQPES